MPETVLHIPENDDSSTVEHRSEVQEYNYKNEDAHEREKFGNKDFLLKLETDLNQMDKG